MQVSQLGVMQPKGIKVGVQGLQKLQKYSTSIVSAPKPSLTQKQISISENVCHARKVQSLAATSEAPEGFKWGANMKNLAISIGVGVLFWFLPVPEGKNVYFIPFKCTHAIFC